MADLHTVQVYTRNGILHMLERRNTSTIVNQVSAGLEPLQVPAGQKRIKAGRLSPHVVVVKQRRSTPQTGASTAPALQLRSTRKTTSCECYAWMVALRQLRDLCENAI
jgi:hypothetical protein